MEQPRVSAESGESLSSADVLLANQLFYSVQAEDYDKKNHVQSPAVRRFYQRLLSTHVFSDTTPGETGRWRALDIGCGTGFLETILQERVGSICALDATTAMLESARKKLGSRRIAWMQADALRLPYKPASFDLVCSNALLHHVRDVEPLLSAMVSLLKPGGRLLLGYEPNAIPYRYLKPFLMALSRIGPEQREKKRIHDASRQEAHARLSGLDIHKVSEYSIFYGAGLHPFRLKAFLSTMGVIDTRVHFTSVYQAALLRDMGLPLPIDYLPDWVYRLSGRMSLSFSLTARKPPA